MKAAAGRALFFDLVSEELLVVLGGTHPSRLVLEAKLGAVPKVDVVSAARATCARLSTFSDVREAAIDDLPVGVADHVSYVLDAKGWREERCLEVLQLHGGIGQVVLYNANENEAVLPRVIYDPATSPEVFNLALSTLFKECGRGQDSLASIRFVKKGFLVFESDYNLFESGDSDSLDDTDFTERFCYRLASTWRYNGQVVAGEHVLEWLNQFEKPGFKNEARNLLVYLSQYGFVTESKVVAKLVGAYKTWAAGRRPGPIGVALQVTGKSESRLAYGLRPHVKLVRPEEAIASITANGGRGKTVLVCFDDCIGSGETQENYLFSAAHNPHATEIVQLLRGGLAEIRIFVYHADRRGIDRIVRHGDAFGAVKIEAICEMSAADQVFSQHSTVIEDPVRRDAFRLFCEDVGRKIWAQGPLGWGGCQWCITYDYSIPDNSLPVLFAEGTADFPWLPLFRRWR